MNRRLIAAFVAVVRQSWIRRSRRTSAAVCVNTMTPRLPAYPPAGPRDTVSDRMIRSPHGSSFRWAIWLTHAALGCGGRSAFSDVSLTDASPDRGVPDRASPRPPRTADASSERGDAPPPPIRDATISDATSFRDASHDGAPTTLRHYRATLPSTAPRPPTLRP
jgi:hypothetical protein